MSLASLARHSERVERWHRHWRRSPNNQAKPTSLPDQRTAWQAELHQEQAAFLRTLRQNVIHQTYAIARQAL
ncbi:hypothetical protein [Leptodesmis sichuanensis]|uniref:hypothetical protein n=1 Tax=Leptodesmis sichuanensis TaxID=2906798 RepID=UPI001F355426|nr:hypothetical protein [Leptodesmis sichuanensis]UIE37211.1 hypothetical protein KIK02_19955 [Leptodesmis sichuanensis A121]